MSVFARRLLWPLLFAVLAISACAKNPVTGRTHVTVITKDKLVQESLQLTEAMDAEGEFIHDEMHEFRVIEVGKRLLAQISDPERDYRFFISKNPVPNACARADGSVVINWGLYKELKSEDELAFILGHEIGHVYSRHSEERYSRKIIGTTFAVMAKATLTAAVGSAFPKNRNNPYRRQFRRAVQEGVYLPGPASKYLLDAGYLMPFSRVNEYEADSISVLVTSRAGYNPSAGAALWERLTREVFKGGNRAPTLTDTHPSDPERIAALRDMIPIAARFTPGGDLADQPVTRYAELIQGGREKVRVAQVAAGEPDTPSLDKQEYK